MRVNVRVRVGSRAPRGAAGPTARAAPTQAVSAEDRLPRVVRAHHAECPLDAAASVPNTRSLSSPPVVILLCSWFVPMKS